MPLQYTPFTPISGNTIRRNYFFKFKKGRIISIYNSGAKKAIIQRFYNYFYSIIANIIIKDLQGNDGHFFYTPWAKCYLKAKE